MIDYQKESENLIKKLDFIREKDFRSAPKFGYFIIKGRIGNEDVVLRISPQFDGEKKEKIFREKLASDILGDQLVAKILDSGENQTFIWSIRKYYSEKTLSVDSTSEELFHNNDIIKNEFLPESEKIISELARKLKIIQESDWPRNFDGRLKSKKFPTSLDEIDRSLIEKSTSVNSQKLGKFFLEKEKIYFNKKDLVPCLGDMSLANILIKTDEVLFYDLEYFCIDQNSIDIAYLWNYLWRYPKWQEKLLDLMISDENSKIKFRFSLIRVILGIYNEGLLAYQRNSNEVILEEKINLYKNHISGRYIAAAVESFEALTEVK
ncbi:MAG: hypothetical protein NTW79_02925 [Candidatus Berkelbacteria bacterium]|nr:hypothetical protein [Candidatus Berkelbacteria bacterium]